MRILIIEDDKETNEFLRLSLEDEYFIVDTTQDGEQGAFLACTNDYDLIILDYELPKKNGYQICQEIRQGGKSVPIIMISVQSGTETKINTLNIGADDYVTKPYSFQELLARIKALLRRPHKLENNILTIDNLTLDTQRCLVKRGPEKIYLKRKEFILLEYLMKNPRVVLSRGMIMEHVWDNDADPFSNTIETHILNIRRKIDTPNQNKLIHTVQGRGYKLDTQS